MDETKVILVDTEDNETGIEEKMEAHRKALLHRAISVFILNSDGEWLIHRRAMNKYHSGGLWTNTCCSHPAPGESATDAAYRRLIEEMGITCTLKWLFSFTYKEVLDNELTEYEFDHVFAGISDDKPLVDSGEVMDWKYISFTDLEEDIKSNPDKYTVWFKKICARVHKALTDNSIEP